MTTAVSGSFFPTEENVNAQAKGDRDDIPGHPMPCHSNNNHDRTSGGQEIKKGKGDDA